MAIFLANTTLIVLSVTGAPIEPAKVVDSSCFAGKHRRLAKCMDAAEPSSPIIDFSLVIGILVVDHGELLRQ